MIILHYAWAIYSRVMALVLIVATIIGGGYGVTYVSDCILGADLQSGLCEVAQ